MAVLEIKNYSKIYGGNKKAADNVSLVVEPGDIYGFIGHNGAGKSTTIRAIVGVLDFTDGEILIDGKSVKTDALACKRITAYIPDNPDLYENLTGIQYLNFVADVFDISAAEREDDGTEEAQRGNCHRVQGMETDARLTGLYDQWKHG